MKVLNIFLLAITFLLFSFGNQSNKKDMMTNNEEQNIYRETESFMEAWNAGDSKKAASFYTEDAVRVGAMGDIQHGPKEIEVAYDNLMHKMMPGAKAKQEKGTIRMLTPELAVWQGGLEISKTDGSPPLKGYVIQIMKKINDKWMILEAHPKFFPPSK
jgi:uncharacterized protein (TIGR02246 family)